MFIVTGGAGFIGSNLVKSLNEKGITDILIVDNLENSAKYRNLNNLDFADYVDKRAFFSKLDQMKGAKIEAVFHMGACSNTMEYNGLYMMENNYDYSGRLLRYCMDHKARFIYASSASVYGDGKRGFREQRECEYPLNIYAYSKFIFDQAVRKVIKTSPVQIVGLRYFNVYGPHENHKGKMASVAFQFHHQIQDGSKIKLFEGSDRFLRDFVYVKDVAAVNLFFLDHPEKRGIFNCGSGKAESFFKIAETMKPLYSKKVDLEFIPFPEQLKGKYQEFTEADLSQLRGAGYTRPFTSLEAGVTEYTGVLQKSEGFWMDR